MPNATPSPPASVYQRALEDGFPRLRFPPALEAEFEAFVGRASLRRVRWAAGLAFVLYGTFVLIDLLTLPPALHRWTAPIRLLGIMPGFLWVALLTRRAGWETRLQRPIALSSLVAGLGTVAVIAIALRQAYPLPYEGLLLVPLYVALLASLTWWRALAVNLITFAAFVAAELVWQSDPQARMYRCVFMLAANLVAAIGGYFLEHAARSAFLAQRLLDERARIDALTGLCNRRALDDHLQRLWRQALRERAELALAMVDVDHFKAFNDRYGHAEGDAALQAVARAVGAQARRPLDMAARYGGEEFMLAWYRPAPGADLVALGDGVRAGVVALDVPHADGEGGRLTVSVGVASMRPTAAGTVQSLMEAADAALYAAKQAGRNRVRVRSLREAEAAVG